MRTCASGRMRGLCVHLVLAADPASQVWLAFDLFGAPLRRGFQQGGIAWGLPLQVLRPPYRMN